MNKLLYFRALCYGFIIVLFSQCDTSYFDGEIEELTWDGGVVAPIASLSYTPATLFDELTTEDLSVSANSENTVTLVFEEELLGENSETFYVFPDQNYTEEVETGFNMLIPSPVDVEVDFSEMFDIGIDEGDEKDDVELTKAVFKQANFVLDINSELGVELDVTFTMNSIKSVTDDAPLVVTTTIDPSISNTFNFNTSLVGYYMDLTKNANGEDVFNNILLTVDAKAYVKTGDQISASDKLSYTIAIEDIETSEIFGDFKQHPYEINNQSIAIDLFDDFQEGKAVFANPSINIDFKNSFGVPIGIDFSKLYVNDSEGNKIDLTGSVTEQMQVIDAPTVTNVGSEVSTLLSINANNSNISELISSRPSEFFIDVSAISNPSNGPTQLNFLSDESAVNADVKIEIPLEVNFEDIVLKSEIDFSPIDDTLGTTFFQILVNSENNMPLSGNLLLQFVDVDNNTVYTTPVIEAFDAASTDADGNSNSINKKTTFIELSEAEFKQLEIAQSINTFVTFNTYDSKSGGTVKLGANDALKINIAFSADVEYSENND